MIFRASSFGTKVSFWTSGLTFGSNRRPIALICFGVRSFLKYTFTSSCCLRWSL